ncbi:MAG: hypothetical protein LKE36_06045 [Bacilli bacterium]|nr:hypothetical protein [Bacilli bacterium]
MKKSKNITIYIYFVISSLFLTGCSDLYKGYTGEHPDLYSVAINSKEDFLGYIRSEVRHQPVVESLEEDHYGRQLFVYSEGQGTSGDVYLIISQYATDENAYFYYGINYISEEIIEGNYIHLYGSKKPATIDNPYNEFAIDEINELKQSNDWGEEIDISKCTQVEIVNEKN